MATNRESPFCSCRAEISICFKDPSDSWWNPSLSGCLFSQQPWKENLWISLQVENGSTTCNIHILWLQCYIYTHTFLGVRPPWHNGIYIWIEMHRLAFCVGSKNLATVWCLFLIPNVNFLCWYISWGQLTAVSHNKISSLVRVVPLDSRKILTLQDVPYCSYLHFSVWNKWQSFIYMW